jgi:hypothetical protein
MNSNLDFAILAGLLAAIYGYMKVAMETVYVINDKRDLVLDTDEAGLRLDRSRKIHLIDSDIKPLIIGLSIFMGVFTISFLLMGLAIILGWCSGVSLYVAVPFVVATLASCYAIYIVIAENGSSLLLMENHILKMPDSKEALPMLDWTIPEEMVASTPPIEAEHNHAPKSAIDRLRLSFTLLTRTR